MNTVDRILPCVTYILELQDTPKKPLKYYVGRTWDFNRRLGEHMMGIDGSKWTRLYKPKRIVGVFKGDCEREKTLDMMLKKGFQHVRGSYWSNIELKVPPACLYEYEATQKAKGITYPTPLVRSPKRKADTSNNAKKPRVYKNNEFS